MKMTTAQPREKISAMTAVNLLKALDAVLANAGTTSHKPAGGKRYKARVIPFELFADLEAAYSEFNRDPRRHTRASILDMV